MQVRRFFVAGAALCDVAFRDVVAGAAFCDVAKVLLDKLQCQGRANLTLLQISWQAQHSVSVLESGGSFAKVILFELCKNGVIRKTRTKSSIFKLKVWHLKEVSHEMLVFGASNFQGERSLSHFAWQAQDFGSFLLEKLKKPRTKCSF